MSRVLDFWDRFTKPYIEMGPIGGLGLGVILLAPLILGGILDLSRLVWIGASTYTIGLTLTILVVRRKKSNGKPTSS